MNPLKFILSTLTIVTSFISYADTTINYAKANILVDVTSSPLYGSYINGEVTTGYSGAMPTVIYLDCNATTKLTPISHAECSVGQWVDIETSITINNTAYANIRFYDNSTYNISAMPQNIKRHGHCVITKAYNPHPNDVPHTAMNCTWDNNTMDFSLTLVGKNTYDNKIEQQSLNLHQEAGEFNQDRQFIKGNIISLVENPNINRYYHGKSFSDFFIPTEMKIIASSFSSPLGGYSYTQTFDDIHGSNATINLMPEALNVSFSHASIMTSDKLQFTGTGQNTLLEKIYLFYGDDTLSAPVTTSGSIANTIMINSSVSVTCNDQNITIQANSCKNGVQDCSQDAYSIAEIRGTWGHVNVDTTCAITVLLPYE